MPIVMDGTGRRTEHKTGKSPIEFVNYIESEQRSNMRHVVESFNPNENLLERIFSRENMLAAWKRVKANKGSAGIDKMTIEDFPAYAQEYWDKIRESLLNGTYEAKPVRRVEIPKGNTGKTRPLGIPTVQDRLIQQAIAQVLTQIFDPGFSKFSYGFRAGKSAHQAVYQLREYIREGYRIAIDTDLSKFFDTVVHDVLMLRVSRKVQDKRVLKLIGKYLRAGVVVKGRFEKTSKGVPQGGPLSPLLANILLDDLDKELETRGHRFARYADDFTILVKSERAGHRVMSSIKAYLERELKLMINQEKSQVVAVSKASFLGFTFKGTKIKWTDKAFAEFERRIKLYTGRSWSVSMDERLMKLKRYLRGWMNYFGISEFYTPIDGMDGWIRRRIRMCYWKQWRRVRTRVGNLLKLKTPRHHALTTGSSRKGYWRLSKSLGTHTGMTNQWLKDQGLISVKELWVNIHYPTTVR